MISTKQDTEHILSIEGKNIGPGHPVFIIAEIGVNHNGDMALAKQIIKAAADSGADCVKFQTWRAEEFMADHDHEYEYTSEGKVIREKMYEMFKRLELPLEWHKELFDYARSLGLVPLTSVADPICAQAAIEAGAKALKLASEDLINYPLLEYVAAQKLPLALSTGMADENEIREAKNILERHDKLQNTVFLHCVSLYPVEDHEAHLLRMKAMSEITNNLIGYSDHTIGPEACVAAVALGACVLEKHFTFDKNLPGPDHAMSADPAELSNLISRVRRTEQMLGTNHFELSERELDKRDSFRRSIVAAKDLKAGEILKQNDLALKRPGNGIHPRELKKIIGKTLIHDIPKHNQLTLEFLKLV